MRLRDPFEEPGEDPREVPPLPSDGYAWRVARWLIIARSLGVAALVLAAILVRSTGATTVGLAGAAVLGAFLLRDLIAPQRLAADKNGVAVVSGYTNRVRVSWGQIESISVDRRSRFGLPTQALEIDAGDAIYTFGSAELDDSPGTVAIQLNQLANGRLKPR